MMDSFDQKNAVQGVQCDLAEEILRSCGTLSLQVSGCSMLPAIWPGDTLLVDRATTSGVREGDVILFARNRWLCAHRIVKKLDDSRFLTRGDASPQPDPVVHSQELLGRVSSIVKNEKCTVLRSSRTFFERAIAALVRHSQLSARILLTVRSWTAIS
ncbi:MAG TPA: S24/S26 family peptidase [Candidatus Sulfotelmatobacter sp.]|nr:S24/S26 family peptidase [Candidatus Sulfotelmatobacter sp.]